MNCQKCGAVLDDNAKFCSHCGTPVPTEPKPKFCPTCGKPIEEGQAFCSGCGTPLNGQYQPGGQHTGFNPSTSFPPYQPGVVPERNIALYVILTIVTCGIFGFYWLVCIVNDLNTAADTPADTSGAAVLLLSIVTCGIYLIYWMYKAGEKVTAIKRKNNEFDSGNNGILYLVLELLGFGFINYCLIQNELNKVAQK